MLPFIDGGRERAREGIRAEVVQKYARQWESATAQERKDLVKRMKAEIKAAMKRQAPAGGLY